MSDTVNTAKKLAERVYAETDFGRSVAISVAGVIGLVVYLITRDGVVAAFSAMIPFHIIRLAASGLHESATRRARRLLEREEAERNYVRLSDDEKQVVLAFVHSGGCVLTWSHVNELSLAGPAIESLIQRDLLSSSMTADGVTETAVLNPAIFDIGQDRQSDPNPTKG